MAFNVPINSIAPTPTPHDWVRPADWISITDTANEVQFLVADTGAKAFTITTTFSNTSGNIYIDWGDGTVDTISTTTATNTSHVYSTGGTVCSRGYNTFKIRIYGDATCVITNAKHIPNVAVIGGNPYYSIGLLEAYFGNNTCTSGIFLTNYFWSLSGSSGTGTFDYLEYVKLPQTISWTSQLQNMFSNCINLYNVVMPTSASALTLVNSTFTNCAHLLDIAIPSDATGITTLASMFASCFNLRTVSLPTSLNSCTSLNATFSNCYSIKNITLPSINVAIELQSMCITCVSLQWIKFTSMPSPVSGPTVVNLTSAFTTCGSLQYVYFPASCSSNANYNMSSAFNSCYSLRNITFPINFAASTFNSCFGSCSNLTTAVFRASMPLLTDFSGCFNGCLLLKSITLPTTSGSCNFANTFNACNLLSTVTFPSGINISSLSGTFANCRNLISVTLPNNSQNLCTTLTSTFNNCYRLQTISLPTSLNIVSSLSSTFFNCYNLISIVFPATMNSVTSASSIFSGCYSLQSITMPTSMSACATWSTAFQNCYSITSITMPSTVSASTTSYQGLVQNCTNLKTLVLPTTQTPLIFSLTSFLSNTGSLTTVTNIDKIGSLTATPLVTAAFNGASQIPSITFKCPFSLLQIYGQGPTFLNKLNSLRLLNTAAGQFQGSSPQLQIQYCDISTSELNILFADLAAQAGTSARTMNITGCTGAAGLSSADRLVVANKGWTIIG